MTDPADTDTIDTGTDNTDNTADDETGIDTAGGGSGFPRWLKWGLLGALAVLVVGYGLIFLYAKVLNDSPDELGEGDLDAALAVGTTDQPTATRPAATQPSQPSEPSEPTAPAATDPAATQPEPSSDDVAAGTWRITQESELGYRVKEILFGVDTEGVGRTNEIRGSLVIDGTQVTDAQFTVDVATIESDDGRRDGQFRGRIMSTDDFPTATFTLTEPIELGTEAVEGAAVDTSATGDLTLRGVTNPVTFDVSARLENGRIGVLGNIPVVFADYEIGVPSVGGISTEDNGLLEFVLVFEPA